MKIINPKIDPDPEPRSMADKLIDALAEMAADRYVQSLFDEIERARKGFDPGAGRDACSKAKRKSPKRR